MKAQTRRYFKHMGEYRQKVRNIFHTKANKTAQKNKKLEELLVFVFKENPNELKKAIGNRKNLKGTILMQIATDKMGSSKPIAVGTKTEIKKKYPISKGYIHEETLDPRNREKIIFKVYKKSALKKALEKLKTPSRRR